MLRAYLQQWVNTNPNFGPQVFSLRDDFSFLEPRYPSFLLSEKKLSRLLRNIWKTHGSWSRPEDFYTSTSLLEDSTFWFHGAVQSACASMCLQVPVALYRLTIFAEVPLRGMLDVRVFDFGTVVYVGETVFPNLDDNDAICVDFPRVDRTLYTRAIEILCLEDQRVISSRRYHYMYLQQTAPVAAV
jgi:hypothetical protein